MDALQLLSRTEMRNVNGGYIQDEVWMECDNCNNDTCRGWVSSCSWQEAVQMCGSGYAGSGGPEYFCVEIA